MVPAIFKPLNYFDAFLTIQNKFIYPNLFSKDDLDMGGYFSRERAPPAVMAPAEGVMAPAEGVVAPAGFPQYRAGAQPIDPVVLTISDTDHDFEDTPLGLADYKARILGGRAIIKEKEVQRICFPEEWRAGNEIEYMTMKWIENEEAERGAAGGAGARAGEAGGGNIQSMRDLLMAPNGRRTLLAQARELASHVARPLITRSEDALTIFESNIGKTFYVCLPECFFNQSMLNGHVRTLIVSDKISDRTPGPSNAADEERSRTKALLDLYYTMAERSYPHFKAAYCRAIDIAFQGMYLDGVVTDAVTSKRLLGTEHSWAAVHLPFAFTRTIPGSEISLGNTLRRPNLGEVFDQAISTQPLGITLIRGDAILPVNFSPKAITGNTGLSTYTIVKNADLTYTITVQLNYEVFILNDAAVPPFSVTYPLKQRSTPSIQVLQEILENLLYKDWDTYSNEFGPGQTKEYQKNVLVDALNVWFAATPALLPALPPKVQHQQQRARATSNILIAIITQQKAIGDACTADFAENPQAEGLPEGMESGCFTATYDLISSAQQGMKPHVRAQAFRHANQSCSLLFKEPQGAPSPSVLRDIIEIRAGEEGAAGEGEEGSSGAAAAAGRGRAVERGRAVGRASSAPPRLQTCLQLSAMCNQALITLAYLRGEIPLEFSEDNILTEIYGNAENAADENLGSNEESEFLTRGLLRGVEEDLNTKERERKDFTKDFVRFLNKFATDSGRPLPELSLFFNPTIADTLDENEIATLLHLFSRSLPLLRFFPFETMPSEFLSANPLHEYSLLFSSVSDLVPLKTIREYWLMAGKNSKTTIRYAVADASVGLPSFIDLCEFIQDIVESRAVAMGAVGEGAEGAEGAEDVEDLQRQIDDLRFRIQRARSNARTSEPEAGGGAMNPEWQAIRNLERELDSLERRRGPLAVATGSGTFPFSAPGSPTYNYGGAEAPAPAPPSPGSTKSGAGSAPRTPPHGIQAPSLLSPAGRRVEVLRALQRSNSLSDSGKRYVEILRSGTPAQKAEVLENMHDPAVVATLVKPEKRSTTYNFGDGAIPLAEALTLTGDVNTIELVDAARSILAGGGRKPRRKTRKASKKRKQKTYKKNKRYSKTRRSRKE